MQGADPPPSSQCEAAPQKADGDKSGNNANNNNNNNNAGKVPNNKNNNRNQNHKAGNRHRDPASGGGGGALNPVRPAVQVPKNALECVICAEPCRALCVFGCGHFTCYSCGLRIHSIQGGACPICRTECAETIITQMVSSSAEKFSDEELSNMRQLAITDRKLKCVIDGQPLARQVCKLYEFLCPADACWRRGEQDPFFELSMLKQHLHTDHKMHYCETCLASRPVFLCEQAVYDVEALQQHLDGKCTQDSISFTGHPQCKFCKDPQTKLFSRFYDGEALLKHMQQNHFTCDLCNRGQFTYTFYQNRAKLDQHFMQNHQLCDHPDCAHMDLMLRVFANEFELAAHKQRAHGIKAKVVLSLDSSMGTHAHHPVSTSGGSSGPGRGGPAAANSNALDITFDHIYRREVINLMPHRMAGGAGKHGGRKGGHQCTANVPSEAGLAPQYYAANALPILVQSGGGGSRVGGKAEDHTEDSRSSRANRSAATDKLSIPEQEQMLQAIINRELRSPLALATFRRHTSEFLQSRLMTSEYYTALATECFPNPSVLAEVLPLLIATTPVESKRTSLREYWNVKQAPETQRMLRQKHEEETKQREIDEQQQIWDELKRSQARPKTQTNKNNGKGNAWQGRGGGVGAGAAVNTSTNYGASSAKAPSAAQAAGRKGGRGGVSTNAWHTGPSAAVLSTGDRATASSPLPATVSSPNAASPVSAGAGSVWGSVTATASPPPATTTRAAAAADLTSEELYPSLPTRPARLNNIGLIGKGKQKKGKPNAWFS